MRYFLLFLLSLVSCSHLTPSFKFPLQQCEPVREFACVNKEPLLRLWCEVHVDAAVSAINQAVGHTVVARVPYAPGVSPVFILEKLPVPAMEHSVVLGVTDWTAFDKETKCLGVTAIGFNLLLLTDPWLALYAQTTVTHELVHALGGDHCDESTQSIMTPSVSDALHSMGLSERDKKTLRNHFNPLF